MASVLITGASKGIGRLTAEEFSRRGHRVVATARDPRTLAHLDVDQRLALDVTDQASVSAAVEAAGEIDILVSNAGGIFFAAVEATPPDRFLELLDLNTVGSLRVAQAVLPGMRARGSGRLLFISSVVGRIVIPPGAAYAATKWALEAFVESLAMEVAPYGVEASLLEPGGVNTTLLDDMEWHRLPDDPYSALRGPDRTGNTVTSSEEMAAAVADAAEAPHLPLRLPVGAPAHAVLAARREAPDTVPFVLGQPAATTGAEA